MSNTITQTLGIDCAQALDALEKLNGGFASWEARIRSTADALQRLNGPAKQVDKLGAAFKANVPEAVQHTERLTTSLGLLSRVAFTQAIVRGLSTLRNAIKATASDAIDFQKQIALTTTIADGAKFDEIAASVRKLSDQFNIPLLQAAEGVYNALSNQVGDFGQSLKFSEDAARFAKATNSSLKDSVDLLSGALASYNLGVEDTDKVSSIFFATIDKGRVNASELANSFGRIGPIASELGVSLEETGGALASISVKGSKTAETLTQFRAILSALQKPSVTMRKTLAELGFTSSELAIKTLGLSGLLDALSKSTGGSAEQMAKLFPNIRGLAGATSLTSDNVASLATNIREMTTAGREFNKEKFLQATATDAERVTEELNKLKNVMTVELGQASLGLAADLLKVTGGTENLVAAGKVAIPTIAAVAAAMLSLKASNALANAELSVLAKGLNALALGTVAVGVGKSIGNFVESKRVESLFKDLNALETGNAKLLAEFESAQKQERDAFNQTNESRVQAALQSNTELNKIYLQDVANAQSAAEKKAAFEKFKSKSAVDENLLGALLNRKLANPDDVSRGIIDAQKQTAVLKADMDKAVAGEQGIAKLRDEIGQVFNDLDRLQSSRSLAGTDLQDQFKPLFAELQRLRGDSNITADELAKVIELRNKLGTNALDSGNFFQPSIDKIGFASSLNSLDAALVKLQEIQRVQSSIGDVATISGQLQTFQDVLNQAAPDVKFQNAATALQAAVLPAQDIASAMERAANAAQSLSGVNIQAAANRAFGGTVNHFAAGGSPRGTDTVSAMLSPGEFVVNAQSSRKFFSQIQAINAGKQPVFRQDGGTVNNTSVGDIHVHGGDSPQATAREVMKSIRREQRRGSGR